MRRHRKRKVGEEKDSVDDPSYGAGLFFKASLNFTSNKSRLVVNFSINRD